MIQKLRSIFSIPELRQKILLTLGLLAVYRVGWWIPLPIVDIDKMRAMWENNTGLAQLMSQVSVFTGTQFEQLTIFGLGIMPYISASIIFQLLATVWAPLEKLKKEGEAGQKKINEYTRYATVAICLFQSFFYVFAIGKMGLYNDAIAPDGTLSTYWVLTSVLTMTAGSTFLMWLGEQIDEYGIGNGISMLIMAGIVANLPSALSKLWEQLNGPMGEGIGIGSDASRLGVEVLIVLVGLFIGVVVGTIFITKGQRRIPTQSAKHIKGRKTFGGTRQFLPLRVNQAGVMPIIFASSLLLFPQAIFAVLAQGADTNTFWGWLCVSCHSAFERQTFSYLVLFIAGIYFFCYFWTAVTFNPKDMADNLKNYGSFIPGYRPGTTTANYLEKVMVRITYVGASFLAFIAVLPNVMSTTLIGTENYLLAGFFGGTSLLIVVSVIIDLVDRIDAHLVMRNYKGLLEKTK